MSALREVGGLPVRTRGERVLQMRMSALFGAKNFKFFEIYGVPAQTGERGGLSQYGNFSDKGKGVNFSRFCADVFYGQPLTS